jgi:hypothetical protein
LTIEGAQIVAIGALIVAANAGLLILDRFIKTKQQTARKCANLDELTRGYEDLKDHKQAYSTIVTSRLGLIDSKIATLVQADLIRSQQVDRLIDGLTETNKGLNTLIGEVRARER